MASVVIAMGGAAGAACGCAPVVRPLLIAHSERDTHLYRFGLEAEHLQQPQVVAVRRRTTLHLVVHDVLTCPHVVRD